MRARNTKSGFTLVEILVVMAIAAILMGLVLGPVVQTFKLTRRAQAMIDAQDAARTAMNQISRELGQAMYVYDNAPMPVDLFDDGRTDISVYGHGQGQTPIMLPVRLPNGEIQGFSLPYAKIDMILPKVMMHCNAPEGDGIGQHPAGTPRDYPRHDSSQPDEPVLAWPPCPVCESEEVEARPNLPLEQDVTVVRYFLGLRYNNPAGDSGTEFGWRSPWDATTAVGEGNQVVLYRAEFSIYDDNLFPKDMTVEERLLDPIFFYRDAKNGDGEPFCDRWQRLSRVVGLGKYEDLVVATRDPSGNVASAKPTITFRTAAIDNDTFAGAYSNDRSFEVPDAVPTVFRSTYGYWTPDSRITVYRNNYETAFSTGYDDATGHLIISKWVYDGAGGTWTETPHFDISEYLTTGAIVNMNGAGEPVEVAFTLDPNRGAVGFALQPPGPGGATTGPICRLDPRDINEEYEIAYRRDRVAIRSALLATFDPAQTDQYLANARIVPGSEQVVGPDMSPNATGNLVRYERVPLALGDPGLNQFKIDYKNGVIYFSPRWDQPLPETDEIQVSYKVQFNLIEDVVRGDYSTKGLISIHMQMRMFDPESGKPHPVDLSDSVKVRNALR